MPAEYLHGVETVIIDGGARPVNTVKTAVIGLIGFALRGPVNELTVIRSAEQGEQVFGKPYPNADIGYALKAIFAQGRAATVVVVNCADGGTLADEMSYTLDANGKAQLQDLGGNINVAIMRDLQAPVIQNSTGTVTYTEGVDYTVNDFGVVQSINFNTLAPGDVITAGYYYFDPMGMNWDETTVLGEVDEDGKRYGLKCFDLAFNTLGYNPKILISPLWSQTEVIADAMLTLAERIRAICIFDFDSGYVPDFVISQRGPSGPSFWRTASSRALLVYPHQYVYDEYSGASDWGIPMSSFVAGLICQVDVNEGYWVSPSNHELRGIVNPVTLPTWAQNDPNTEANALNAAGVATVALGFGTGLRFWGNRTAAFPVNTDPTNFIVGRRVSDILHESIELAMLPFIDKPLNDATIDSVLDTVNQFVRTLIKRGALVDGNCYYDPDDNPPVELSAGHLTLTLNFMMPLPMERITFKSFVDINLLQFQTA